MAEGIGFQPESGILESLTPVRVLNDALEFVSAGWEHNATRVLLEASQLPPDFFELKTRFAGEFIQKLLNYGMRVAGVFPEDSAYSERFREFLLEAREGRQFRVFADRASAETWLKSV